MTQSSQSQQVYEPTSAPLMTFAELMELVGLSPKTQAAVREQWRIADEKRGQGSGSIES